MLGLLNCVKNYARTIDKDLNRIHEFICVLSISVSLFFLVPKQIN